MPKTIVGKFQFPDGSAAANAVLYLKLSQDAVALGTSQIAPRVITVTLDGTGSIPVGTTIYANDELTPGGTVYIISVIAVGGGLIYGPDLLSISGTSPINLNTLIPTNVGGIVISYPNPVLQNPSAPQTITGQSLTLASNSPLFINSNTVFNGGVGSCQFAGVFPSPTTAGGAALGTNNLPWSSLSIGFAAGQTGSLQGTFTASRTITFQDATGTVALKDIPQSFTGLQTFTLIALQNNITLYNNIATVGNGVASIHGATSQKSESAADTNVLTFTPPAVAGSYRIRFIMSISAANAATLGWTATWTDSNGNAQTPTNLSLFQSGVAAPALTFTTSAAGNYYSEANIDINNAGTSIVIKLTFSGTSFTAKVTATIERIV